MASQNLLVDLVPNELNVSMIGLKNNPLVISSKLIRIYDVGGPELSSVK